MEFQKHLALGQSLKAWTMVFGSVLHAGQIGGISIPLSLSVAFTAML